VKGRAVSHSKKEEKNHAFAGGSRGDARGDTGVGNSFGRGGGETPYTNLLKSKREELQYYVIGFFPATP